MHTTRRTVLACAPLAALARIGQDPADPALASVRQSAPLVFLVRHAETTASTRDVRDPELSGAGLERAGELARMLAAVKVTHVFATEYMRTQCTLTPLAARRSLEVQVIKAADREALVQALRGLPAGAVAVVAGHSNTVTSIVAALGGSVPRDDDGSPLDIDHDQHDRAFLVAGPRASGPAAISLELRVGAPPA